MPLCAQCGSTTGAEASVCPACGAPIVDPLRRELRKTVTVVFSDIADSTALGERLDPEALHSVLIRYYEEMRAILEGHGGTVREFMGDGLMAVFGIPQSREDDAGRAVSAAVEMRSRLVHLNAELLHDAGVELHARTG